MIDTQSATPIYMQLAHLLRLQIEAGEYAVGEKIASENQLAKQFRIGRPTVRQATELLVQQGILSRKRGAGTYVEAVSLPNVDLLSFGGTGIAIAQADPDAATCWLGTIEMARRADDDFYRLRRLSVILGKPALLEDLYLRASVFADLPMRVQEGDSISNAVMEEYGYTIAEIQQQFAILMANEQQAERLGIRQGMPLLSVDREIHLTEHRAAVQANIICRSDLFNFRQTIMVPRHHGKTTQ
ncbi:MAG: GntR family transcriptional regulator [Gammaproteobacteria bacterium]|nr:GntR family transcriptional regulator [Gammaproteobacteria bacterium]